MASTTRKKGNKSSIVRVIISNFDDRQIKELKVLYHKQGGVDTIQIDKMAFENEQTEAFGQLIFKAVKAVKPSTLEDKVMQYRTPSLKLIDESGGGNGIIATKYASHDQESQKPEHILRKYKITGTWRYVSNATATNEGERQKEITVFLEDIRPTDTEADRLGRRKKKTSTSRVLLSKETIQNYRYVLSSGEKEIDSRNIYKMNRFIEYRSSLLFYYTFINHFMVAPVRETYNEVWKIEDNYKKQKGNIDEVIDKINDYLYLKVNDFIDNHNQHVDRMKMSVQDAEIELLKVKTSREKNSLKASIRKRKADMPSKIEAYDKVDLRNDLIKILAVLSDLRHKLGHFEYAYFDNLLTGNGIGDETLTHLLDLKLFKVLSDYIEVKKSYVAMYLDGDERCHILGSNKKLKKIYEIYQRICETKNGFNGFINSLMVQDGIEHFTVKEIVKQDYRYRINLLKTFLEKEQDSKKLKETRDEIEALEAWLEESDGEVYYQDIQLNPKYKVIYNAHKSAIEKMNVLLVQPHNDLIKAKITDQNQVIKSLKEQMESITKRNSRYRLEYKMRIAFGYLQDVFNMDLVTFKSQFNLDSDLFRKTLDFLNTDDGLAEQVEKWLVTKAPKTQRGNKTESAFDLGKLTWKLNSMKDLDDHIFESNKRNNLFKLYALLHLLLPQELKGDFLGFVKKNYYDLKNVDFQSIGEEDHTPEISKDTFFHHMRLFEKGARRYDLFHYEIQDAIQSKADPFYYRKIVRNILKNDFLSDEIIDEMKLTGLVVRPIMKVYENIFHLASNIELRALIKIAEEKKLNSIEASIKMVLAEQKTKKKGGKHYNFACCLEYAELGELIRKQRPNFNVGIRNAIMHLNLKELLEDKLQVDKKDKYKRLQKDVMNLFVISERLKLNQIPIGSDLYNDYLMRYDQTLFSLKKSSILSKPKGKTLTAQHENQKERDQDKRDICTVLASYKVLKTAFEEEQSDNALKRGDIRHLPEGLKNTRIDIIGKKHTKRIVDMSRSEIVKHEIPITRVLQKAVSDERGRFLHKINFIIKSELTHILAVDRIIMINVHTHKAVKTSADDVKMCTDVKPKLSRFFFLGHEMMLSDLKDIDDGTLKVDYLKYDNQGEIITVNERSYLIDTNQNSSFKVRYVQVVDQA